MIAALFGCAFPWKWAHPRRCFPRARVDGVKERCLDCGREFGLDKGIVLAGEYRPEELKYGRKFHVVEHQ